VSEAAAMSTTTEHVEHAEAEAHGHHDEHSSHKPTSYYVKVTLILAALTALETSTYWIDFGPFFMPALLIMMAIKFVMVVSLFMHLKFDNKIFSWLFYSGLILAVLVYCAFLACFQFFSS
jgi:cytochrome c oxidase subunit 4